MEKTNYNGWANYETWRINLEILDGYEPEKGDFTDIAGLAEYLKEYVDDVLTNYGEIKEGLTLDYARAFASEVDFYEIAEHIADDYSLFEEEGTND